MATGVQVWSQTAVTNATVDTNVNLAEGMAASAVNDSARAMMASVAKWRDDQSGTVITSGTTSALTALTNQSASALTSGFTLAVQFGTPTAINATLAVDGLAAKPIQIYPGSNLLGSEFQAGSLAKFTYSTTGTGAWLMQTPPAHSFISSIQTADVAISSTSYTSIVAVSQGSSGVWFAVATITTSSTGNSNAVFKLWDGTTVAGATVEITSSIVGAGVTNTLCGLFVAPAGNIKVSGRKDTLASANWKAVFNGSAESADTTLAVVRLA